MRLPVFRKPALFQCSPSALPRASALCALVIVLTMCFAWTAAPGQAGETEEASPYPMSAQVRVNAVLRSGPGTSYAQVQVISAGLQVILLGKEDNWYQVQRGSYTGYMREDLLRVTGTAADPGALLDDWNGLPAESNYLPPPSMPGSTAATAAPAPEPGASAPEAVSPVTALISRVLKQGSQGPDVLLLQQLLAQHGCDPGGLDGMFGPRTRSAVVLFQKQNGLLVDGIVGPQTASRLAGSSSASAGNPAPPSAGADGGAPAADNPQQSGSTSVRHLKPAGPYLMLNKGSAGAAVTALQTALNALGYYHGAITGNYDTATFDAVKAFQGNNGTGVDGIAGPATQTILYDQTPRPAWETAPLPKELPAGAGKVQGPSPGQIELAHWFKDVKLRYRAGQTYLVYDPASGLGWNLRFFAMGNHADSEPLTQLDTDIMFKAFGYVNTWTPKAVYARMPDGRWILASMHNVPHLTSSIPNNGFNGHLCVHFYRDLEECMKTDPNYGMQHQNTIRSAWARIKG